MESVTQQNAATAEESASAAEELTMQATTLENVVENLTLMVKGLNALNKNQFTSSKQVNKPKNNHAAFTTQKLNLNKNKKAALNPENIIPLDEDDDF